MHLIDFLRKSVIDPNIYSTMILVLERILLDMIKFLLFFVINSVNFETVFEKTNDLETASYQQTIDFYTGLAMNYPQITLQAIGKTDSGKPLHIVMLNNGSNGADYQYTLTHLFTQHNKLGGKLGEYLNNILMLTLEDALMEKNLAITPYVNVFNKVPESGFSQFMDYPRYSTGYTTLFNTFG